MLGIVDMSVAELVEDPEYFQMELRNLADGDYCSQFDNNIKKKVKRELKVRKMLLGVQPAIFNALEQTPSRTSSLNASSTEDHAVQENVH
jgi:hypothetical protein